MRDSETDAMRFDEVEGKHTIGPAGTSERGPVTEWNSEPPHGNSLKWTRTIAGQTYGFTLVTMPDGEIRWSVVKFNGYAGGPRFGCAWSGPSNWTFNRDV